MSSITTCETCRYLFVEGTRSSGLHYVCKGRPQLFRSPDAVNVNPEGPHKAACEHYALSFTAAFSTAVKGVP